MDQPGWFPLSLCVFLAACGEPAAQGMDASTDGGASTDGSASIDGGVDAAPRMRPDAGPPTGMIPDDITSRYLARRPALADQIVVIDASGEPTDRMLLATTMQGQLNRDQVRVYVVGSSFDGPQADQRWIDRYQSAGLVSVSETIDLDTALDRFAGELGSYILASPDDDWSVNVATAIAAAEGGIVSYPSTADSLSGRGMTERDPVRGAYPDAVTAYTETIRTYKDQLAYPGVAVASADKHCNRDFYVQQGIMPIYTRPGDDDFDAVYALMEQYPTDHPIYGYVAANGTQEATALVTLSSQGRFLVPSDTMSNLSFHSAVSADQPRAVPTPVDTSATECGSGALDVVLAISDGDNIRVPLSTYAGDGWWPSSQRTALPMGWSMGPDVAVLMPAIWDYYAAQAGQQTELVSMMGIGYALPSQYDDPSTFYVDSFRLEHAIGLRVNWSLDLFLSVQGARAWRTVLAAGDTAGTLPDGFLLNYTERANDRPALVVDGTPVLSSRQQAYSDGPPELRAQIESFLAMPDGTRPPLVFFAITVWATTIDALVTELSPLADSGVHFLSPSEGVYCARQ